MSYPPRPPILEFPNWWSVIAYNPQNGAFGYGEGNMIKPAQNKALKDYELASMMQINNIVKLSQKLIMLVLHWQQEILLKNMLQFVISE